MQIERRAREVFALLEKETRGTLALWASNNTTSEVEGRLFYVVSRLEVHPEERNRGLGPLALSLAGHRAVELGCGGVILDAMPEVQRMYLNAGATIRSVRGWPVPAGLVTMVFEGDGLSKLLEAHDELREEG